MSDNEPLVFCIGAVKGLRVMMTSSRKSRMALIKNECHDGEHIALSIQGNVKWVERPDVNGEDLTTLFRTMVRIDPVMMKGYLSQLFPGYAEIPLSEFGFQTGSNDAISAARKDIHAHVIVAIDVTWRSGIVPRFVDPIDPVPFEKRESR